MTIALLPLLLSAVAPAPAPPDGNPAAIVDLETEDGARLVGAAWRWREARVVHASARRPGADLRPSGPPARTLDVAPRPGAPGFDGPRGWTPIAPADLRVRRGTSRLSFGWYRTDVTIPARVGALDPTGATIALEIVVDDYAEVWVDGKLPRVLGQRGGAVVAGFNAPNRVVLTRDARPGQRFAIAVFATNGPLSASPENFLWVRSATLDFHLPAREAPPTAGHVLRRTPALDGVVPPGARVERIATGFQFTEGPVWHPDGYLLFSDPNANRIYRWDPAGEVSIYRTKSGYSGRDVGRYRQPGSNGLTLDREGRLLVNQHGNRQVVRIEPTGAVTVLADRWRGKRLNSPNDLVLRSDGALYFTDPPFGLPGAHEDPARELPPAVYRLKDGELLQVATDLSGPNGIAFSPDERTLYVSSWDVARKVVLAYDVAPDGSLARPRVFHDAAGAKPADEALDGVKVDHDGNVFVSAPDGVRVISPSGEHLGTIVADERPANLTFGDADGRTLYLTGRTSLYRVRVAVPGIRPAERAGAVARR